MPVITAPQPSTDERLGVGAVITIVIAVLALLLVGWTGQLAAPRHVDHLVIDNPAAWSATVDARRVGAAGWTGIGTVGPATKREYSEVLDMGANWNLRFRAPGGVEVTTVVTRDELKRSGWTMSVPAAFAAAAKAAGLPPSTPEASAGASAADG
jgi:opacity protein-like surface antigen